MFINKMIFYGIQKYDYAQSNSAEINNARTTILD